jgi:hypothetical protein
LFVAMDVGHASWKWEALVSDVWYCDTLPSSCLGSRANLCVCIYYSILCMEFYPIPELEWLDIKSLSTNEDIVNKLSQT